MLCWSTVPSSQYKKKKRAISMNTYCLPVTQWPAVSTEFLLTKTPPQTCANRTPAWWIWRLTDHGHAPVWASCPPTIRDPEMPSKSGRCPHSAKQNRVGYMVQTKKQSFWCTSSVLGSLFVVAGEGFFVVFWSTLLLAAGLLTFAAGAHLLEIPGLVLQVVWNMCYFCCLHAYCLGMELWCTLRVSGSRPLLL